MICNKRVSFYLIKLFNQMIIRGVNIIFYSKIFQSSFIKNELYFYKKRIIILIPIFNLKIFIKF